MISARTLELIERLKHAPWFERVGQPIADETVVQVAGWRDAVALALSSEWQLARLHASNDLSGFLAREHRQRFFLWNKIVCEIDQYLQRAIADVARRVTREYALPQEIGRLLDSTACLACVEAEYSDLVPPGFFSRIAEWYLKGHFPCGLTDKYPKGKLMVF
jgi:hypothetical protein